MHHVRVAFDHHIVGDLHAAGIGHAANVVAAQVHQHHVFGDFFRVGQQVFGQCLVFFARFAARAGAGDGAHGDGVVLAANQDLRRRTHHVEVVEVVEEHVRRRVQAAQRTVQRQRRVGKRHAHALGQHHLHDVAVQDVVLGVGHVTLERLFAVLALRRGLRRRQRQRDGHVVAQAGAQLRQAGVGLGQRVRHRRVGVDHQVQLAGQVVHHGQLFGQHQQDVGGAYRVGLLRGGQAALHVAHGVVAEVAHQAAGKARQAGDGRGVEALAELFDEGKRVALVAFDHLVAVFHLHAVALHAEAGGGRQADEGVAAGALAAYHRFQQVGVGLVGQLQVHRQRGVQVGEQFEGNGNAVVAGLGQLVEGLRCHASVQWCQCGLEEAARGGLALPSPAGTIGQEFHDVSRLSVGWVCRAIVSQKPAAVQAARQCSITCVRWRAGRRIFSAAQTARPGCPR